MWKMLLVLAVIGGGAAYWWQNRDSEALRATAAAKITRAEKEVGIRQMLGAHDTFTFASIVVDLTGPDGTPEFRGQIRRQESLVAAYGQLNVQCEKDFNRADCWEIALLEADGRAVELETAPELPGTEGTGANASTIEDHQIARNNDVPQAGVQDLPKTPTDPEQTALAGPEPTHFVSRARINSRTGPGTSNPVVTQLTENTRLRLQEAQSGWGQFKVMDGPAEGQTVWIALSLTTPI